VTTVATIHRNDVDALRERLTSALVLSMPQFLRDLIGSQVRAVLAPMIDRLTKRLSTLQDLQVATTLRVAYHTPNPQTPPDQPGGGTPRTSIWFAGQSDDPVWSGTLGSWFILSCDGLDGPWTGVIGTRLPPFRFDGYDTVIAGTQSDPGPVPVTGETNVTFTWNVPIHITLDAHLNIVNAWDRITWTGLNGQPAELFTPFSGSVPLTHPDPNNWPGSEEGGWAVDIPRCPGV
jgi:hypothetical protein